MKFIKLRIAEAGVALPAQIGNAKAARGRPDHEIGSCGELMPLAGG